MNGPKALDDIPLDRSESTPSGREADRGRLLAIRDTAASFAGAVLGLAPHVLHHVGAIAGAALITGAGGNLLFFTIGVVFSIPLLRRPYRRLGTWLAPSIAVGIFAALFSLSAFVIGPAIAGGDGSDDSPPAQGPSQNHGDHHG